jgi:hypothetical protein
VFSPDPLLRRKALYSITDEKFRRAAVPAIMYSLYIYFYKESLINPSNEIPHIHECCVIIYVIGLLCNKFVVHAVKWDECRSEADEFQGTLPTGAPTQKWGSVTGRNKKSGLPTKQTFSMLSVRKVTKMRQSASLRLCPSVCLSALESSDEDFRYIWWLLVLSKLLVVFLFGLRSDNSKKTLSKYLHKFLRVSGDYYYFYYY